MNICRLFVLACGAVGLLSGLVVSAPVAAARPSGPAPRTPIKHLVVLMQEQHSFDNYFGTYPGADGLPSTVCMPLNPRDPNSSNCVRPFHLQGTSIKPPANSILSFQRQYRDGHMDGFIDAFRQANRDGTATMGYYNEDDLSYYWQLAQDYVLFDRFFSSTAAGSLTNHLYWVAAAPGGPTDQLPDAGWGDLPTIFDRLQEHGISWKFYVDNFDPTVTFRHREHGPADTQLIRVPLLNMPRFVDDPELAGHIVGLDTYYDDVRNGTLPAVSYIVSLGSSEQPPSDPAAGQRLVKGLLDTLLKSDAWASAAFLLTYDDSGGWYDHVPPPNVDDRGYGFRVPSLLISPYVRRGYVEHTVLDFTSILRFIEDNYGLQPLTTRDATAQSLEVAFNFSQTPRAPAITSLQPPTPALTGPRRLALELSYSAALVGATVIIAWAAVGPRLQRRRATAARKQREGES